MAPASHNEAQAVIEGRDDGFDVDLVLDKIKRIEDKYWKQFGDRFETYSQ